MKIKHMLVGATVATAGLAVGAMPASAGHDHFVLTPNGKCHQVAAGQTGITEPTHGGHHQFHDNVHLGATESTENPDTLGDGKAKAKVYKRGLVSEGGAPRVCDGND